MSQPVDDVRRAVRTLLDEAGSPSEVAVAVSGGADSLALAAATAQLGDRRGLSVLGLIVDHRLQEGSAETAERAAKQVHGLGVAEVRILEVDVGGPGGPEAAARRARYAALREAAGGRLVLLGHTRDDQAETVLLGLGRGSGPRSIAGMRRLDPPWGRPLLSLTRATTAAACADLGLEVWQDPHNSDPSFARVRLRHEVLPLLEEVLQGGVGAALARTAAQLREDTDALDTVAARTLEKVVRGGERVGDAAGEVGERGDTAGRGGERVGDTAERAAEQAEDTAGRRGERVGDTVGRGGERAEDAAGWGVELEVAGLVGEPAALRRRVLRLWLLGAGVRELSDGQLRAVDALIGEWRGQGGVWLPGGLVVGRARGRLTVSG